MIGQSKYGEGGRERKNERKNEKKNERRKNERKKKIKKKSRKKKEGFHHPNIPSKILLRSMQICLEWVCNRPFAFVMFNP